MNHDVFEKYSIPKAVATLATPTVLSMLVNIIYNMADTFFVGQTGDPNQVAAVSLTTPVFMLTMAIGNIFGIGGSAYISRLLGQKRGEDCKHVSSFCFYGCIVAGFILMAIFLLGMEPILNLMGTSANTYQYAYDYLYYIGLGAVFTVVSMAFGNIVRSEGAAKASMFGMMLGTITNIILDPIMIIVLDMGVAGAAIATVIGNIASFIYYVIYFNSKKTALSIKFSDLKITPEIVREVFLIGIPASINNVLMSTANIVLNNYLAIHGDNAVAAMGVAMKVNMLVVLVQIGLAAGIQPLLGYCYGARKMDRFTATMNFARIVNIVFGSVVTAIYFMFTSTIIQVFINDAEVIALGVKMIRTVMITGPFIGTLFINMNAFQAMGKALPSLILSISRQGLVFIPVVIIMNSVAGLNGIIFAQPIADIASLVVSSVLFMIIKKQSEKQFAEEAY